MIELAFWREVGISEVNEAEVRYQAILEDKDAVPFGELDEQLQRFIRDLNEKFPDAEVVQHGSDPQGGAYSRLGVIVRIGDDMPKDTYGSVMGLAAPTRLTMYDPESQLVMGDDDSIEIEIHDRR